MFIGWQKSLKAPMELDNISLKSLFEINSNKNFVTINDCLSDIGKPTLDDDFQFYKKRADSDYQKYLRNNSKKFNHHFY